MSNLLFSEATETILHAMYLYDLSADIDKVYNVVIAMDFVVQLSVKVVDQMLRLGWEGDGLAPLMT